MVDPAVIIGRTSTPWSICSTITVLVVTSDWVNTADIPHSTVGMRNGEHNTDIVVGTA